MILPAWSRTRVLTRAALPHCPQAFPGKGFSCSLSSYKCFFDLPPFQGGLLLFSMVAQMTFANMPNEELSFNQFMTSPPAVNRGICIQFPDTMRTPKMCWNTFTRNTSTASLRVTLAGPLAKRCCQAGMGNLCCEYKWMCFGQLCSFWNSRNLPHVEWVLCCGRTNREHVLLTSFSSAPAP